MYFGFQFQPAWLVALLLSLWWDSITAGVCDRESRSSHGAGKQRGRDLHPTAPLEETPSETWASTGPTSWGFPPSSKRASWRPGLQLVGIWVPFPMHTLAPLISWKMFAGHFLAALWHIAQARGHDIFLCLNNFFFFRLSLSCLFLSCLILYVTASNPKLLGWVFIS